MCPLRQVKAKWICLYRLPSKLKVLVRGCYIPFYREQSLCWFGKSEAPVFKAATIKEMPAPFISETV